MPAKAVVLFSGGQDSTTVLGKALSLGLEVFAIGFDYGQRHVIELIQASTIVDKLGVPFKIVELKDFGKMVTTGLTKKATNLGLPHERMKDLPASFVPNRNALFLTLGHAYAQEVGAASVWGGMCQTDYSGYPDCREEFIEAMEDALNIGYQTHIDFVTPLMYMTKADTFALAADVGVLDVVINDSNTCYNGDRTLKYDWGYGCAECPACKLRIKGWQEYKGEAEEV